MALWGSVKPSLDNVKAEEVKVLVVKEQQEVKLVLHPKSQEIKNGEEVIFKSDFVGEGSIQWEVKLGGKGQFKPLDNAKDKQLSFEVSTSDDNNRYRAVLLNKENQELEVSKTAILTVK